ncbi:protein kinase [Plantactinospora sp. B24E8]|uniref:serine/threonine-protein kinase n=1 Tax=Plantactinospora sp. B24E8 TaxID=3153567 RepID=UPI00325D29E0
MQQVRIADRYLLLHTVGSGGMGRVWLATDEMLRRPVAMKQVVPPAWMTPDERAELSVRTLREARTAARLNHPNVVRVYDVVHSADSPWIVMEYVPSRSVQQVLDADGPLSPRRTAEVGLAVLAALRAAHASGVLHRDVKPHNVLIADDGRVVLTDFGLATVDGGDGALTRDGVVLGSPQYVSPERAADGSSTVESDLWSLGATLYAAVEGRSPYSRPTTMATLTALAVAPPDPMSRAGPLRPVLAGLLRRDPRQRLTADEVERLLRRVVDPPPPRSGRHPLALARSLTRRTEPPPDEPPTDPDGPTTPPDPAERPRRRRTPNQRHQPGPRPYPDPRHQPNQRPPVPPPSIVPPSAVSPPSVPPNRRDPDQPGPVDGRDRSDPADPTRRARPTPAGGSPGDADRPPHPERPHPVSGRRRTPDRDVPENPSAAPTPPTAGGPGPSSPGNGRPGPPDRPDVPGPAGTPTWVGTPARGDPGALPAGAGRRDGIWSGRLPWTGARPRRFWRILALALTCTVLAALGAGLAVRAQRGGEALPGPTSSPTPPAGPTGPAAFPCGRPPGQSVAVTSAPRPPEERFGLIENWTWYTDPSGFRIAVPIGWQRYTDGTVVCFREPVDGTARLLSVDPATPPTRNAEAYWRAEEHRLLVRGVLTGYEQVEIGPLDLREGGAVWECRWTDPRGERVQAVRMLINTSNRRAYTVSWLTREFDWGVNQSYLRMLQTSFRPSA